MIRNVLITAYIVIVLVIAGFAKASDHTELEVKQNEPQYRLPQVPFLNAGSSSAYR